MEKESTSMIGRIIDLPQEEFEKELVKQKVNIGTINNIILNLQGAYHELEVRKDGIMELLLEKNIPKEKKEVLNNSIKGLYVEMLKVESKVIYLNKRYKELADVDKTQIDNKKTLWYTSYTVVERLKNILK